MIFRAIYSDGEHFEWNEDNPSEGAYEKIDRSRLVAFEIRTLDGRLLHRTHLERNQNLVVRRRPVFEMTVNNMRLKADTLKDILYICGIIEPIGDTYRMALTVIFSDGHTELITEWKKEPLGKINLKTAELAAW